MSIRVELGDEAEARLRMKAAAKGMPVEEYVEGLIRQAANSLPPERPTLAEFEADWAQFAEGLDHIAPVTVDAFSREAMYGEHD